MLNYIRTPEEMKQAGYNPDSPVIRIGTPKTKGFQKWTKVVMNGGKPFYVLNRK